MKLTELIPGDKIKGFAGFGCIPDNAVRIVRDSPSGLYVKCRDGVHLLDGQEDERGNLVGLERAGG